MLTLDRVTLCCIDCVNHELALAAIGQCVQKCGFARVLFLTDRDFALDGLEVVRITPLTSRDDYSRFVIKELAQYVHTEFVLIIQWDGFIVNPSAWTDEFLTYDYIGAKWGWYDDGHTVGNGGFSLRSKRLLDALADTHISEFAAEDLAICRSYRPYLEANHAIRFAPEEVADRFAFEGSYFEQLPFGFHGLFNFWLFFQQPELAAFLEMATPGILGSVQCLQLAKNYAEVQRGDEAAMVLRKILGAHPAYAEAASLLKSVAGSRPGTDATTAIEAVGRNNPCPCGSGKRYKECHGALGQATPASGTSHAPESTIAAVLARALAVHQQGDLFVAESLYQQALRVEPANAIARHYLGVIAYQQQRFDEARGMLERALVGNERQPDFHNNLGLVLHRLGELDRAIGCFEQARALKPDYVEAHNNLGLALQDEHCYEEALACFDQALALRPEFAEAHWNRALLYLLNGDYDRGWREYEWRLRHPLLGLLSQRSIAQPRWGGSEPGGKTIFTYCEQGFGDALQFIRYAALLRDSGAKVIVEAPGPLRRLFSSIDGITAIAQGEAVPRFDWHAPLLSLPLACATRVDSIPHDVPYLFAAREEAESWRKRLDQDRGFRVGLVWAGNLKNNPGQHRACPPGRFDGLAQVGPVSFYSLQKDRPAELAAPALALKDFTAELTDFAATAALIANLDLVITIDSAVAHLAGALGRPTWVLLPYERDWRWLRDREDSPWYPTVHLFQQTQRGNWDELFTRVAAALSALVQSVSVQPHG
jgi:tetratricopeptide (TPR) repeat protein